MAVKSSGIPYLFMVKTAQMARRTPGSVLPSTEFVSMTQAYGISFTVPKETTRFKSVMADDFAQTLFTKSSVTDIEAALMIKVAHNEAFRASYSGVSSALTGTAGTVTGEAITFPATAGVWQELAHKRISSPVITGAVLGVDYDVLLASGKICALAGSSLLGTTTAINYSYAALAGSRQAIGNLAQVEWAFHAELQCQWEPAADLVLCEIDAATVDPDGAVKVTVTGPDDKEETVFSYKLTLRKLPGRAEAARLDGLPVAVYNWPNI